MPTHTNSPNRTASLIRIDGSTGEGGGQMLRSALSLSLVTGKPFVIENIRARRQRPGLLRQHLTAVTAAAEIGSAQLEGASLGSKTLVFHPGRVRPGNYRFAVGTAGSATLVFQTIFPALMLASGPSQLTLEGGTHNTAAPPFDFLEKVFLPILQRMGPKVSVSLDRYGFYPAGGGRFTATIDPCERLAPLDLLERGEFAQQSATAIVANLPRKIAERELDTARHLLNWPPESTHILETKNSVGPGNILMIELANSTTTMLFSAFGELGKSSEAVAHEAAQAARAYLVSGAVADEHLVDQLLLPFALAGAGSYTAEKLNLHARTNIDIIRLFLPHITFDTHAEGACTRVTVQSA